MRSYTLQYDALRYIVISTGGRALAAAVERPLYFARGRIAIGGQSISPVGVYGMHGFQRRFGKRRNQRVGFAIYLQEIGANIARLRLVHFLLMMFVANLARRGLA